MPLGSELATPRGVIIYHRLIMGKHETIFFSETPSLKHVYYLFIISVTMFSGTLRKSCAWVRIGHAQGASSPKIFYLIEEYRERNFRLRQIHCKCKYWKIILSVHYKDIFTSRGFVVTILSQYTHLLLQTLTNSESSSSTSLCLVKR